MTNKNRVLVPEARTALDRFKYEVSRELGIPNYETVDKGDLTSRQNGSVGGAMVKKMIKMAEQTLAGNTTPR